MSTSLVDWSTAFATATKLIKPSPEVTREAAAAVVAELRDCAVRAEAYVTEVTGLAAPGGTAPVLVVDRPGWIQANLDGFRQILTPFTAKAEAKLESASAASIAVGSRVTGVEVGALLSYLAPRVLGQYDPFFPDHGRLLLVAPNIVSVEREMLVDPHDFRLWVCLHEETHRVQFTAVDWLGDYVKGLIAEVVDSAELDAGALGQLLRNAIKRIVDGIATNEDLSILDLVQTPAQREVIDRITAVMSLVEGHADVVMDGVGPEVVRSVESIRRKFTVRRQGEGFDKVVRKLLGLDAKMRQYRDGASFCRAVIDRVGMDGFNRVWTSPDTLPTRAEIGDPELWLARVHG